MKNFSVNLLKAQHAILSGEPENVSLTILLQAFVLGDELIATSLRLDGIDLPSVRLAELVSKSFDFPLNPEDGYIDGSIYLGQRHHPLDIHQLAFHANRHGTASLLIKGRYLFAFEADAATQRDSFILNVPVSSACLV